MKQLVKTPKGQEVTGERRRVGETGVVAELKV